MNMRSLGFERARNCLCNRESVAVLGCLLFTMACGAVTPSHDYYCPKYEAVIQFQGQRVLRSFGGEFPSAEFGTHVRTGTSSSYLVDCSTAEMLCFEEKSKLQGADVDSIIYAVPKQVRVGDTYQMRGVSFRVDRYPEFPGLRPSVVILAERGSGDDRIRYKMHIQQTAGITNLHFDRLNATPPGSLTPSREYTGVSCALVSKRGLLAGVRLKVPPPSDVID
jgi:hypothetical protein